MLLSFKNSPVLIYTKLHLKSCYYLLIILKIKKGFPFFFKEKKEKSYLYLFISAAHFSKQWKNIPGSNRSRSTRVGDSHSGKSMLCAHGFFYIFKWFYQNVWFRLVLWAHNIEVFNLNVVLIQLIFRSSSWIPLHVHDGCVGGKGGDCWRHSTDQVLLSLLIDISTFNWEKKLTKMSSLFWLSSATFCDFIPNM